MNKVLLIAALCTPLFLVGCVSSTQIVVGTDKDGNEIFREVEQVDVKKASLARTKLAYRLIQIKHMSDAKVNLELAEKFYPDTEELFLTWGYYYATVGDDYNTKATYEAGIAKYDSGAINTAYGSYLCIKKQYKEAEERFLHALEDKKYANISTTYSRAAVCAYESGDVKKADDYFTKAMNYGGTSPDLLFNYATFSYEQQDYVRADKLMQTFEMFEKNDTPQTLFFKIKIANKLNQFQRKDIYAKKLLKLFPDSEEATKYNAEQY